MMGLVPLEEKTQERRSLFTPRGHRKKVAICMQTRKTALTRHQIGRCLDLGLQTSRTVKKKCLLLRPASTGYLVNSCLN